MKAINLITTPSITDENDCQVWNDCPTLNDIPDSLEEGHGMLIMMPVIYEGVDKIFYATERKERIKVTKSDEVYYANYRKIGNIDDLNAFLKRVYIRYL